MQFISFGIGIILARLLSPSDYGITAVIAVFVSLSNVLVDSGFKLSIIRSKDSDSLDYSTIFIVNMLLSMVVTVALFSSASAISNFFDKPELLKVVRVYSIIPFLNGFGLVQSALLFKNLQYKRNALLAFVSNILSGVIAIYLAYHGYSYWALVWKVILYSITYNLLLWLTSCWRPGLFFSFNRLNKHFRYSSKVLLTSISDVAFGELYSVTFGKFYTFSELGFYKKARNFVDIVSKSLSGSIERVNMPYLAAASKSRDETIDNYRKVLRATAHLIFSATVFLVVLAKPLITLLIGEKWLQVVPFMQILAIQGALYPLANAGSSLLQVLGHSGKVLLNSLITKPIQIFILLVTLQYDVSAVLWGFLLTSIIGTLVLYTTMSFTLKRSVLYLLSPIVPALLLCSSLWLFMIGLSTGLSLIGMFSNVLVVLILLAAGFGYLIIISKLFKIKEYKYLRKLLGDLINIERSSKS